MSRVPDLDRGRERDQLRDPSPVGVWLRRRARSITRRFIPSSVARASSCPVVPCATWRRLVVASFNASIASTSSSASSCGRAIVGVCGDVGKASAALAGSTLAVARQVGRTKRSLTVEAIDPEITPPTRSDAALGHGSKGVCTATAARLQ